MKDFKSAFMNSIALHSIASNGYRRAARTVRDLGTKSNGVGLEGALVAVIFSTASLEAFIAEIPFIAEVVGQANLPLSKLGAILDDAESSKVQVTGKFLIAKALIGTGFDRGKNPYQDFQLLVRIRNAIIHMKPDIVGEDPHKLVRELHSRNLCNPEDAPNNSWMDQIATVRTAHWACNVACSMVRAMSVNDDGSSNAIGFVTTAGSFKMLSAFDG